MAYALPLQQRPASRLGVVQLAAGLLIILNVAIPKGGVMVRDFPLTWGYVMLAVLALPALFGLIWRERFASDGLVHFGSTFLLLAGFVVTKTVMPLGLAPAALPWVVNLIVIPFIMLVLFSPYLEEMSEEQIGLFLKWSIRAVIAWGLFNFLLYALVKQFITIPYVTVNGASDMADIYGRNNRRGALMKLVATYNNGNLFGVCILMLTPLYLYFEKSRAWIAALVLAIVCSLSRTVWFGGMMIYLLMIATGQIKIHKLSTYFVIALGVLTSLFLMTVMGWGADRLADTNLGGRFYQISTLEWSAFGTELITIREMIYMGMLQSFGIVGFAIALLAFTFPLFYGIRMMRLLSPLRRAAFAGVASYLIAGAIDGAMIFPPTLAIFFFCCGMLYRRGYIFAPNPPVVAYYRGERPRLAL